MHPDLQPASYLMLTYVAEHGPMRASAIAEQFDIDKGAVSRQVTAPDRARPGGRGSPTPTTAAPRWSRSATRAAAGSPTSTRHRRKWLDERLGDWSEADLTGFVERSGRYNRALDA